MSDINKGVVFEISVMRHMETDNNCHHFAGCHSATTSTFLGAVFEQLFLPLGDKYFAKIIDIATQLIYSCLLLFRLVSLGRKIGAWNRHLVQFLKQDSGYTRLPPSRKALFPAPRDYYRC